VERVLDDMQGVITCKFRLN